MILHLGDDVAVHSADIVAIIDLTDSHSAVTGAMLAEIRRQNRILQRKGVTAKSAVICAGARRAGGATENPRVYLSPISTATLAARAHENAFPGAFPLPEETGGGRAEEGAEESSKQSFGESSFENELWGE